MRDLLDILTPPYNWDSMEYRLPRILQWVKNGIAEHYATNYLQQVAVLGLLEFINTHVYIFSLEKDSFVCMLQGISFLMNGFLVYSLTYKLIKEKSWSYIAAIMWYVYSIAIAELLTTQTDVFTACWMISYIYMSLVVIEEEKLIYDKALIVHFVFLGTAIRLAYNTKMHIIIGTLMFTVLMLAYYIQKKRY